MRSTIPGARALAAAAFAATLLFSTTPSTPTGAAELSEAAQVIVRIYLGGGMAISALNGGVRVHAVNAMTISFTAYLRTGIYQLPKPTPAVASPTPDPTPSLAPVATDRPVTQLDCIAVEADRPAIRPLLAR